MFAIWKNKKKKKKKMSRKNESDFNVHSESKEENFSAKRIEYVQIVRLKWFAI